MTKKDANIATATTGVQVLGLEDEVYVHSVPAYLKAYNKGSVEDYKTAFPDAPLYSETYEKLRAKKLAERKKGKSSMTDAMASNVTRLPITGSDRRVFSEIFDLGDAPAAKNARGEPIKCEVLGPPSPEYEDFVPEFDKDYVFPIAQLKAVMVAAELNKPMLLWGLHGTGKTTLIENYCAGTNRPWMRVQHTISTEEAHVLGHYVVKNGATEFELGPLPIAMRDGLVYVADEYDFAMPSVTSVYQPVLEGKPLVIKEAPPHLRVIKPHPNFRFFATGNTNGAGDETGLYAGTQIMNAANYSRFGVTIEMDYMPEEQEIAVISRKSHVHHDDARRLVQCAAEIRREFRKGALSATISPRELINAAELARVFGREPDLTKGMEFAYTNRLNSVDRQAVNVFMSNLFG